jgi:Ca2+/H+ antiporter
VVVPPGEKEGEPMTDLAIFVVLFACLYGVVLWIQTRQHAAYIRKLDEARRDYNEWTDR